MKVYYIKAEGHPGIFHNVTFTTEKLAVAYLSEDATLTYNPIFGWQDASGQVVATLHCATLRVD